MERAGRRSAQYVLPAFALETMALLIRSDLGPHDSGVNATASTQGLLIANCDGTGTGYLCLLDIFAAQP